MAWALPWNVRYLLTKENLPLETARYEEIRKTATIIGEPSSRIDKKEKPGRR